MGIKIGTIDIPFGSMTSCKLYERRNSLQPYQYRVDKSIEGDIGPEIYVYKSLSNYIEFRFLKSKVYLSQNLNFLATTKIEEQIDYSNFSIENLQIQYGYPSATGKVYYYEHYSGNLININFYDNGDNYIYLKLSLPMVDATNSIPNSYYSSSEGTRIYWAGFTGAIKYGDKYVCIIETSSSTPISSIQALLTTSQDNKIKTQTQGTTQVMSLYDYLASVITEEIDTYVKDIYSGEQLTIGQNSSLYIYPLVALESSHADTKFDSSTNWYTYNVGSNQWTYYTTKIHPTISYVLKED